MGNGPWGGEVWIWGPSWINLIKDIISKALLNYKTLGGLGKQDKVWSNGFIVITKKNKKYIVALKKIQKHSFKRQGYIRLTLNLTQIIKDTKGITWYHS